jgi:ATP-dependent helicase Lhr and Lhr-like helicase
MQTVIDSFVSLDLRVEERYRQLGWQELTPIQAKSYRMLVRGRSSLLVAPTGSGKTEAAVIPIFARLASTGRPARGDLRRIRMLYITPLRALNRDIFRRVISYAEAEGLKADIRHGDTPSSARAKMLVAPPDVLITTPETLAIILTSRRLRLYLQNLEVVVVDELHELLGNERGSHLSLSLERLQRIAGEAEIMRVGLSATVGDLEEAASFLVGGSRSCAIVTDKIARGYDVEIKFIKGNLTDVASGVLDYVKQMKGEEKATLVFTNTRDEAEFLGAVLKAKSPDIPVEVHHGSLSKESREFTESSLRAGGSAIVVSTSSLELGLDIGSINLVVQIGSPRQSVKLIQRIGRGRHTMRERAVGALLTNRLDDELESVALLQRIEKSSLEATLVRQKPLDVIAHHLVGLALEENSVKVSDIISVFERAYPFRNITIEDIDSVAKVLERHGILRYDGEVIKRRGPRTFQYYFTNVSTIPDIQQFDVIDITTKKFVGRLDQVFVGEYAEVGKPFVLKGNTWKILSIEEDKQSVHVEPMFRDLSTIPYWVGELLPVEFETAQIVGKLRRQIVQNEQRVSVSNEQTNRLKDSASLLGGIPDEHEIVIEAKKASSTFVLHACFGTKINQTLATILSTLLSAKIGYLVEARSDAYRILLSSSGALGAKQIVDSLKVDLKIDEILQTSIIGTHPLNWKTWYVAKKFGVVEKGAQYDRRAARLIQERFRGTAVFAEIMNELFHEKYDVEKTKQIMNMMREGTLNVRVAQVLEYSELAKPAIEFASGFAAMPLSMEKTILDLVKKRIDNSRHKLLCLSCGRYESVQRTADLPENIVCPLCHSRLVTETYLSDQELPKIIRKKKAGQKTSEEEEKNYRRAWKTSSLIQQFGKKAIVILSGFGVGVDTAARIIRKDPNDDEVYRSIYLAEKNYVATRGFWQD